MIRHISWGSVPNAAQYRVRVTTDGGATVVLDNTSPLLAAQFTGVPGKTYLIEVNGMDAAGVHGPVASMTWNEPQPAVATAPPDLSVS